MATNLTTSSGTVTVGESGSNPIVEGVIGSTTPTVTAQTKGQSIVATGSTPSGELVPIGMTTVLFFHIRFFDNVTGAAANVASCTLNTFVNPNIQEFLYSSADASAGLANLSFITPAAGNSIRAEYEIAGV